MPPQYLRECESINVTSIFLLIDLNLISNKEIIISINFLLLFLFFEL